MSLIVIDRDQSLSLLRKVVDEHGADKVYVRFTDGALCLYVHGDECGCIVGHVLHKAGMPIEDIARLDAANPSRIRVVSMPDGWLLTQGARYVLDAAQRYQDLVGAWGGALSAAEATAEQLAEAGVS